VAAGDWAEFIRSSPPNFGWWCNS